MDVSSIGSSMSPSARVRRRRVGRVTLVSRSGCGAGKAAARLANNMIANILK